MARRLYSIPFVLAVHLVACSPAVAQPSPARAVEERPIVRLLATGGTISARPGSRLSASELLSLAPGLDHHVRAEAEQFSNVDSASLSIADWIALSRRIGALFAGRPDLAGVVVTMGTDTMEELAYFLHLTVRDVRPVVVVGAMRSPDSPGFDGPSNLLDGFRVAADPAARGLGTLVVLNDEINAAREVTKTDTRRVHTFQTRGYGVLGIVDQDRISWYRRPTRRGAADSEFDILAIDALPRVDVLLSYVSAPGDAITEAVDRGARGLVIASAAGGVSTEQGEALRGILPGGPPIVLASRTGAGRIIIDPYETGWRSQTIAADDLPALKARVLLMLGLAKGASRDDLRRMFREY